MRTAECSRIRNAFRLGRPEPAEQRHLFACPACRAHVRLDAAWKSLPRPAELEVPEEADEGFLRRVLEAVRADRRRRQRNRIRLAAAAALLISFLAGAAQELTTAESGGAEETYAELTTPSPWDGLLTE